MKERTKPIGIGITAILAVLLLIGSISVAGASGDDYSAEFVVIVFSSLAAAAKDAVSSSIIAISPILLII
ncbi:MAG: hypothetical protein ACT6FG_07405 [Methanosarcinaceae archaeon]